MAKTYRPYVPEQDLLLPPSLREWLPEDHLAFFVSDLIDQLDLTAGDTPSQVLADAGYCSDESLTAIAATGIDAYVSTRKQRHGERLGPCPRGPLPKSATIVDRVARKLRTKRGAAVYAARKGIVEPVLITAITRTDS